MLKLKSLESEEKTIQYMMVGESNDIMINATELCLGYDKSKIPSRWLKTKDAKKLIETFKKDNKGTDIAPIITFKYRVSGVSGGFKQGTWMHRQIVIQYAQWIDPTLSLRVFKKLDKILEEEFSKTMNREKDKYKKLVSKANYYDQVLTYSGNLYTTEQLSRELNLGLSSIKIHKKLNELGYLFRRGKNWYLTDKVSRNKYTKTVTKVYYTEDGEKRSINSTKWTESGKYWIWSLKETLNK